jgi:glycosyltransferase involved in cell wall biosynthesis
VLLAFASYQLMINRDMLRVLLFLHEVSPGAPSVTLDAFEWMKKEVTLRTIAFGGGFLEDRYRQLGRLDIVPTWQQTWGRRLLRKWSLRCLRRGIGQFRPELLYVNSITSLRRASQLGIRGVPVLVHVHELESFVEPVVESDLNLLLTWPARFIVVSQAVRNLLVNTVGVPVSKVALVYEFIRDDVLAIEGAQWDPTADRKGGLFVVGGAGADFWRKGITLWLQMAAALKRLLPERLLEFRWVGLIHDDDARKAKLEARKLGIENIVRFLPRIERPLDHFREFDVFAMTSWEDPCPLVVLENMALGKPVVCFQGGGGAPEEVGSGGLVIPAFRPEMMAAAIAQLVNDRARREHLGRMARSRVKEMFVVSVQAPRLLDEMIQVAARSTASRI